MNQQLLTIGVIGKSLKENEKRVAIHPEHIKLIPQEFRKQITFEEGYGLRFGTDDSTLANLTSKRVASRQEIFNNFDCVLMPKPLAQDLKEVRKGAIIWGWPHCVQQKEITQISIDRKLTLIAWEEMFNWNKSGDKTLHTFYKNNEIAGYAGVHHALGLVGITGSYGKSREAVILSFGSVSRGAIYALQGQGFTSITVYTRRVPTDVANQLPGVSFKQMKNDESGNLLSVDSCGNTQPFSEALTNAQIIVNGILQNTENPLMFVSSENAKKLQDGTLIIDISCDEGMGFWCAQPTTFENPIIKAEGKFYYAVDHSPSYYWDAATWDISKALIPFLPIILGGEKVWKNNETISKAIEISKGVVKNSKILSFQKREKTPPHNFI